MLKTAMSGLLFLLLSAMTAEAHGGRYLGPPGITPPGLRFPTDPVPPPQGPPTPTPPPTDGPATPPRVPTGPNVGIPNPARPTGRRPNAPTGPALTHWTYWWTLNRERILRLRELQDRRLEAKSSGESARFFGGRQRSTAPDPAVQAAWDATLDVLLKAVKDENDDVATGAVLALGKAGDARALSVLSPLVTDRTVDRTVNESAALALGMIGDGGPEARAYLAKVAADPRQRTRTRAFAALGLGFLGDPGGLPALMSRSRARESARDVPACALLGLGLLGDEMVVPDLAKRLAGPSEARERDDILRAYHAAALGMLRSRAAIPALVKALSDKEKEVRRQAALSLGPLARPNDDVVIRPLLHALGNDRDSQTRAFAAVALGEIAAPAAADALLYRYRKGDNLVVPFAALGLALLVRNSEDPSTKEKILPFLRAQFASRGSNEIRGVLAVSLGIAEDENSIPALRKSLGRGGDPVLRAHAAIALGLIGADAAIPELRAALEQRASAGLQREAALALSLLGDREAVKILTRIVKESSSDYVRGSAAVALGRLATPETADELRDYLADEDNPDTTRAFVAVALGLVMDRRPLPVLTQIWEHFNHRMAVEAVAEVLTLL